MTRSVLLGLVGAFLQDCRHGARLLRRERVLTAMVLLTLSLGIGANAAFFSLLNAVLLRPLPYPHAERLTTITDSFPVHAVYGIAPTVPEFLDLRARTRVFEHMAFFDLRDYQVTGGDEPYRVSTARVTASFFPLLGVQPAMGRLFRDADNLAGGTEVAILSDGLWRRSFGADPHIVGKAITVIDTPYTVVGVLPPGFAFDYPTLGVTEPVDLYVPFTMIDDYMLRSGSFANVRRVRTLARLTPGTTPETAAAAVKTIAGQLVAEHAPLYRGRLGETTGFTMEVVPLHDAIVGQGRALLLVLFGAVGVVLLIACVNTAQFLLARTLQREHEVAVRAALGATRGRLVRQFLAESLVLTIAGGALGLWLSSWIVRLLVALVPTRSPLLNDVGVDARVLAFTCAVSIVTALACGFLPAVQVSHVTPQRHMTSRGGVGGRSRSRHALVAIEVALSVILLVAASVLLRGLLQLQQAPRGFSSDHVIAMQLRLPYNREAATKPIASLAYQQYLARIGEIPGVEAATISNGVPMWARAEASFTMVGGPEDIATTARQTAAYYVTSDDYFRTLRIPLVRGRVFTEADTHDRPRVAIVNQEMVRRYWPHDTPIGKRIRIREDLEIVGVVGDVRITGLETSPVPQIYVPLRQEYTPNVYLTVRATIPAATLVPQIKQAVWTVAPEQPLFNVRSMDAIVSGAVAAPRFNALLIASFAALALIMSAAGVYGVVAYAVSRRVREIAVRMAIGARRADVFWTVAGQTLAWTVVGLAVGAAGAVGVDRLIHRTLEGAGPLDPLTLAATSAVYLGIAVLAVYVPARRAFRLDPVAALRAE